MSTPHRPVPPPRADGLPWTASDALVAVGAAVLDLLGYSIGSPDGSQPIALTALVMLVLAAMPLLARRRYPLASLAGVLVLGLALNLRVPVPNHFNATLCVALFAVARSSGIAVAAPAALVAAGVPLLGRGHPLPPPAADVAANVLAAALVIVAAEVLRRWQHEMEVRRSLLADRAVAQERRRIARELHDIVAHHITTMQLMAGGARANLGGDTEVVRDALVTLEGSGRMALREMRQLLDVLRAGDVPEEAAGAGAPSAPQPGVGDLAGLVEESRRAGLPTEFAVLGQERPLPPSTSLAVFRIVQESLTNTRKHAGGRARARVHLTYHPDRVTVEVSDNGSAAPTDARVGTLTGTGGAAGPRAGRTGYGLIGMRERVALQGGSMVAGGVDGGGFRVVAGLPTAPPDGEDRLG
ncbi:signal transduction histidine kinase [Streptomyces sp. 1114.5]|uniref:sensor histidine kinase n=1 Tax=unclassified Streptomyces TaxID=2593676 RepID=UPI000BDC24A8|nr:MULTISPECIES: histidine kinase [unclassified Streptomyces]RKT11338.1 signal transduction histidine kinase [Streptomyces sp. 1114.5]SOB81324.1 Signal transduction histidine kinase [Streptomyces sp. 1331.2]